MLPFFFCILALHADPVTVLEPDRVFDGISSIHKGWIVAIQGEKILFAGPKTSFNPPTNARILLLSGTTLTPGLIDAHSHLLLHPYDEAKWEEQVSKEPVAERISRATVHARANLLSGFTTLRDLGTEGAQLADVGIKSAIEKDIIPGPRLLVTTRAIVATGSYAPRNFAPEWRIPQGADEADGDHLRTLVRRQIREGADWIKIYADTPHGLGPNPKPAFSIEELKLVVATAADAGVKVAAHAQSKEGMKRAALAGVASIEHGDAGDIEVFRLMAQKKIGYCPTLATAEAYARYEGWKPNSPLPAALVSKKESFKAALESGVLIGNGSDIGVFPHGQGYQELEMLVKYGMTPLQALRCATSDASKLLALENKVGMVKEGMIADLAAFEGDFSKEIKDVRKVKFVMKSGTIYKQP
ncbi:MAG: amidohydrolase family protein [Gemmataceae bacterium]|nr:amidohydrolase family protein [Gemmataceae bacterium]